MVSRRALAWSGLAVAVAVMLSWNDLPWNQPAGRPVAVRSEEKPSHAVASHRSRPAPGDPRRGDEKQGNGRRGQEASEGGRGRGRVGQAPGGREETGGCRLLAPAEGNADEADRSKGLAAAEKLGMERKAAEAVAEAKKGTGGAGGSIPKGSVALKKSDTRPAEKMIADDAGPGRPGPTVRKGGPPVAMRGLRCPAARRPRPLHPRRPWPWTRSRPPPRRRP